MASTPSTLIAAWEAAWSEPEIDRAPSLLAALGQLPAEDLGSLTVGQCDASLFALRRATFGDRLEILATCPSCGAELEIAVSLADLQPVALPGPPGEQLVEADGFAIACRLPRNADLRALDGRSPDATTLLARCVREARRASGEAVAGEELPATVAEAVLAELAARDPGAQVLIGLRCPCDHEWTDELDIRGLLWTEVGDWVQRTLQEVHDLARSYGWSEAEILALSPWRRRWYLEASGC
jgi:hypothetical protein